MRCTPQVAMTTLIGEASSLAAVLVMTLQVFLLHQPNLSHHQSLCDLVPHIFRNRINTAFAALLVSHLQRHVPS